MGFTLGKQDWFNSQESIKVILHINRLMRKTHIVLTINAKTASEKISFMQNSDKRNQKRPKLIARHSVFIVQFFPT